jgi:hypothetical protein
LSDRGETGVVITEGTRGLETGVRGRLVKYDDASGKATVLLDDEGKMVTLDPSLLRRT